MDTNQIDARITEIEAAMATVDFWADKTKAQAMVKELQDLKDKKEGIGGFDRGGAIVTILSAAGGDDAAAGGGRSAPAPRRQSERRGHPLCL